MIQDKEPDLTAFFQAMKEKDREIPVPDFPELPKKQQRNWWIPLGIAATLLLGFFLLPEEEKQVPLASDVIIITLEKSENQEPQILIEESTYLEIWTSPTESLLAEY
ncbi:MAG TPA: hypothetical protein VLA71_11270 [Algoriphagus sp.]|nr:hypothetical protein [Algoriphagus sp.]